MATHSKPTLFCDDGTEIALPFKWIICGTCNGHGKSSAYLGAYTQSEMDEAGPDFHDEYMRGGYDRTCDACEGAGKVTTIDWAAMSKAQRSAWNEQVRADRDIRAIERAERAMGA